eukprot:gene2320-6055_t
MGTLVKPWRDLGTSMVGCISQLPHPCGAVGWTHADGECVLMFGEHTARLPAGFTPRCPTDPRNAATRRRAAPRRAFSPRYTPRAAPRREGVERVEYYGEMLPAARGNGCEDGEQMSCYGRAPACFVHNRDGGQAAGSARALRTAGARRTLRRAPIRCRGGPHDRRVAHRPGVPRRVGDLS